MFTQIRNWWYRRIIRKHPLDAQAWNKVLQDTPLLNRLNKAEQQRLQELVILFLHYKNFVAAKSFAYDLNKVLIIAAQACLPILHLGIQWYSAWSTIIVYPSGFAVDRQITDEHGVVHHVRDGMSGEAWLSGPVILSWTDTEHAGVIDGENLVIHEFAHKLDMLNGAANGMPPLHRFMSRQEWTDVFTAAFEDFNHKLAIGEEVAIDSYAATDPAEFFAVTSEVFFERPDVLRECYPAVYRCLHQFYHANQQVPAAD